MKQWTAFEFANVCVAIAEELRRRARAGEIAPAERLALYEWYGVVKDIVGRVGAVEARPSLAALDRDAVRAVVVSRLRVVGGSR